MSKKRVIAIDPGNVQSAMVTWDGETLSFDKDENPRILKSLLCFTELEWPLVIEKVASYGMPVGETIFETVYWTGRFAQAYGVERVTRIPRMDVKMHLCHTSRAKDGNIRQALIDRFGPPGTKKKPGRLYGVSGDSWAALALAVLAYDKGILQEAR